MNRSNSTSESPAKRLNLDLEAIDARIKAIDTEKKSRAYEKQKSQLEKELGHFLDSLPCPKTVLSASPQDILRFLVWKDCKGRTQVHLDQCPHQAQLGRQPCRCPTRLAAGTVDSVTGKLRAIYNSLGRSYAWDDYTCRGNPVMHPSIKSYLKSVQLEQANARTPSKQATPVFFDKFYKVICHIRSLLLDVNSSPSNRYILARDLAFFALSFSTGGRASDLGRIKTVDVLQNPDGKSLLIHQRIGKTLRGKNTRAIPIRPCANPAICAVANLRFYENFCKTAGIWISDGFLFRSTSAKGTVINTPFFISAAQNRLKKYLLSLGIYDGETPHGFRSATAILLSLFGASKEEVAHHIGWQSSEMVTYYCQVEKVMGATESSSPTNLLRLDNVELAQNLSLEFRERNLLSGFKPALASQ